MVKAGRRCAAKNFNDTFTRYRRTPAAASHRARLPCLLLFVFLVCPLPLSVARDAVLFSSVILHLPAAACLPCWPSAPCPFSCGKKQGLIQPRRTCLPAAAYLPCWPAASCGFPTTRGAGFTRPPCQNFIYRIETFTFWPSALNKRSAGLKSAPSWAAPARDDGLFFLT